MKKVMRALENFSGFLMLCGVIMGLFAVFYRYILKNAIIWGDEASIFIFIWMLYFALSIVTYRKNHLNTNIIQYLIKSKYIDLLVNALTLVLTSVISIMVIMVGFGPVKTAFINSRFSDSGVFPMGLIFLILPLGFFCNVIACTFNAITEYRSFISKNGES